MDDNPACDNLADPRHHELADSSDLQQLACFADRALVTGDYNRCVAIVENIYNLLDRQTRGVGVHRDTAPATAAIGPK